MEAALYTPSGRTPLDSGVFGIGSTQDNRLVLSGADINAHHAQIRPEGQGYSVVDMGSNAGTFVNEQKIYPNVPQMLQNGDSIRVGSTTLAYEMLGGSTIAPTMYAAPGQSLPGAPAAAGYAPTIAASSGSMPSTSYGAPDQYAAQNYSAGITPPPPA